MTRSDRSRSALLRLVALLLAGCGPTRPELVPLKNATLRLDAPSVVMLEGPVRPVVQVVLNGGGGVPFLLDTGAETTVIDRARAEALRLPIWDYAWSSAISGSGAQAASFTHYAHVSRLQLGALEVDEFRVTVLDDPILARHDFAGVLGQDLLARVPFVLDAELQQLHLLPAGTDESGIAEYLEQTALGFGTWAVQPTHFTPRPFLPLRVAGIADGTLELLIDTGADGTSFPELMLSAVGAKPERSATLSGIGGDYTSELYALQDFDLLGFRVSSEVHRTPLAHGVLGMNVLSQFVLVVDAPGERVWLHHRGVKPHVTGGTQHAAPSDGEH